jgi:hypothetical protein
MVDLVGSDVVRSKDHEMNSNAPSAPWREIGLAVLILALSILFSVLFRAVVVQFGLGSSQLPLRHAFYYADSTASQMAGAHLSLRRSLARLN